VKRFTFASLCIVFGLVPAQGQTPEQKKATITYLQKLQTADGGFLSAAPDPNSSKRDTPSLRATSSALRALKYFGGEPRDRKACAQFVASCFDKTSGGFADQPGGKPEVFTTAVGIMAVVELKLPTDPYAAGVAKYLGDNAKTFDEIRIAAAGFETLGKRPAQVDAWLEQVAKMRNADGTFGKDDGMARDTGSAAVVVLRLGGKLEQRDQVVKTLKAGQRADGGFGKEGTKGSDLETSYRVMRGFLMLKEKPAEVERLRAFVAKCRNHDGGYGVSPGQPSTVSATYFASIILHWLGEK
jgi:hypothetical protein